MLPNLNELVTPIADKIAKFNVLDCTLPEAFTSNVPTINKASVLYGKSASCITNANGQRIFLSNNWFYIAAILAPLHEPFYQYKNLLNTIVSNDDLKLQDKKTIRIKINAYPSLSQQDKEHLVKFATDPLWWNGGNSNTGGKTLDRNDALVSSVLSIANLVNASQSYIATLWNFFGENPKYVKLLNHEADLLIRDSGLSVKQTIDKFQTIYYGAPGSGKSFKVNKLTAGQTVIRTTFHPDTDYASFVGAYKPVMDGKEISYGFIKQAFLKAYLAAWKKYVDVFNNTKTKSFVNVANDKFTITDVQDSHVIYDKEFRITKRITQPVWEDPLYWNNDVFAFPSQPHSGRSSQEAICYWIFENFGKISFDSGWTNLITEIKTKGTILCTSKLQKYNFSLSGEDDTLIVKTYSGRSYRSAIKKEYDQEDSTSNSVAAGVANILREINPNDFDKAWEKLWQELVSNINDNTALKRQYLVIEEINRGNCAQIFGDIFQLLDRQDNGFSTYPIVTDSDIQKAIFKAFREEDDFKLQSNLNIDSVVPQYESVFGSSLSDDVANGRVMLLPPNLYVIATMNTSDQSLFPMDSAFKRRWDWEYVPIEPENAKSQFIITIDGLKYRWKDFLIAANAQIEDVCESEDKQMGNFFIKNNIGEEEFKSKVMFYLWSEVCKEEFGHKSFFRNSNNSNAEFTFNQLYPNGTELLKGFMAYLGVKYDGEE